VDRKGWVSAKLPAFTVQLSIALDGREDVGYEDYEIINRVIAASAQTWDIPSGWTIWPFNQKVPAMVGR
jgi:hypothetical protein